MFSYFCSLKYVASLTPLDGSEEEERRLFSQTTVCDGGLKFLWTRWKRLVTSLQNMAASIFVRRVASRTFPLGPYASSVTSQLRFFSDQEKKWTTGKFDEVVNKDKVVVFMKGVPAQPMCGFSNAVVQILGMHGVEHYGSYNVLEDDELRQGVKEYSSWPTVPQVYMGGEFIGGCDIMLQMHQNGELINELKKIGIRSLLLDKAEEDKKDT